MTVWGTSRLFFSWKLMSLANRDGAVPTMPPSSVLKGLSHFSHLSLTQSSPTITKYSD